MQVVVSPIDSSIKDFLRNSYVFDQTSSESCIGDKLICILASLDTTYIRVIDDKLLLGTLVGIKFSTIQGDIECLSYLCVDRNHRSQGITKILVARMRQELNRMNVTRGYCLTTIPLSDNTYNLRSFYIKPNKKILSIKAPRGAKPKDIRIVRNNLKPISWNPTQEEFDKLIPLMQVHGKSLSIHDSFVSVYGGKLYTVDYLVMVIGCGKDVLANVKSHSTADVIMGYEVGPITSNVLNDIGAKRSPTTQVLSIIGDDNLYVIEGISLPIL